jgi:hypothetical protein
MGGKDNQQAGTWIQATAHGSFVNGFDTVAI